MADDPITQADLIEEYFRSNPNREIKHEESVPWLTMEYKRRVGKAFKDPDRGIRKLHEEGFLIKIGKGIYKYDPELTSNPELYDFTVKQKELIKQRDNYKCVICGKGSKHGVEIHVDHIRPRILGGTSNIENGQILCAKHNFQKRTLGQTETGKKLFIRLNELARKEKNNQMEDFSREILEVFERYGINSHIKWERD